MAIGDGGIESVLGGRADALAMNPRAQQQTIQKGRQDVRRGEVPSNLLDLLAMQKLADDKQRAKAEMDASMQSNPATIKDQLERQLMQSTKADVARQVGGALNQQQAQAQKRMSQIANQRPPAPNLLAGVAGNAAPNMARMAGGGIVAFAKGDMVEGADVGAGEDPQRDYAKEQQIREALALAGETPESFAKLSNVDKQLVLRRINAQREYLRPGVSDRLVAGAVDIANMPIRGAITGIGNVLRDVGVVDPRQKFMGEAPITDTGGRDYMPASSAIQKQLQDPNLKPMGIADLTPPTLPLIPPEAKQAVQPAQGIAAAPQPAGPQPAGPRITAPQVSAPKGPGIESLAPPPRKLEYKNPWATEDGMMIAGQLKDLYGRNIAEYERKPLEEMAAQRGDTAKFLRRDKVREDAMKDIEALKALDEIQAKERGGISALSRYLLRSPNQSTAFGRLGRSVLQGQETAQQEDRARLLERQKMRRDAEEADRLRAAKAVDVGEDVRKDVEAIRRTGLTGATSLTEKMAGMISDQAKQMLEVDKANLTAESANSRDRMEFVLGQMRNQTAIDVANLEARISMIRDATERTKVSAMNARNRLELLRMTIADVNKLDSTYAKLATDALAELKLTEAYIDASKEGKKELERKERELYEAARKKAAKENRELIQRLKGGLAEGFTSTERSS